MKAIFWNNKEKRIRTPFRIIAFLMLASIFATILSLVTDGMNELLEKSILNFLIMLAILLSIYLIGRYIDKRKWADFGITILPFKHFLNGALLGSFLITFIFGIQYLLGWLNLSEVQFNKFSTFPFLLVFIGQAFRYFCGSIFEEAFSRGYLLINIAEGLKRRLKRTNSVLISYVITSSIFGILHLANANSSLISIINLILVGFLFGWMVIKTGKLHFAIGLHAFWNIFQNNIFGGANSGKKTIVSIFTFENSGNVLWTGGDFGIEGGLLCTVAIIVTLLIMIHSEILGNKKLNQKVLNQ